MGGISNYLEAKILDLTFNNTGWTNITDVRASLHTADPGETGANEFASSGAYARVTGVSFGVASGGAISNDADVVWAEATADWGTATHLGLWNQAGDFLWGGPLTASRSIVTGVTFRIPSGDLDVALD